MGGKDYDVFFKVIFLGEMGVGKTSMFTWIRDGKVEEIDNQGSGNPFFMKKYERESLRLKVQFFDTEGQERFRKITSSHYRGCNGIFLLMDPTQKNAFDGALEWKKEIDRYAADNPAVFLIATKKDKEDEWVIDRADMEQWAEEQKIESYYEISSLNDGENIQDALDALVDVMMQHRKERPKASAKAGSKAGAKSKGSAKGDSGKRRRCVVS